jgi:DNA-directed RNA polymerase subunit RPC12/RpoP
MTRFNHCPNCHTKPSGGLFGAAFRKIYECKDCQKIYCDHEKCGHGRCPNCGSKRRAEVGKCYSD